MLGTQRALVIHGDDGLDEVTLAAATLVWETGPDGPRQYRWTPADFGLPSAGLQAMQVAGPAESAALIREILAGRPGPPRNIVVANAAAALWLAARDASLIACARLAAEAIDSGAARTILARLVEITNG